MPIYLEDATAPGMPKTVLDALLQIADAAIDRVVTPGVAIELLRLHLRPAMPPAAWPLFDARRHHSWDSILVLYADLLSMSKGEDPLLVAGAQVVGIAWRHSKRPDRELMPTRTVDVASFLRMAGYAKLTVPLESGGASGVRFDWLRFCRYCWRLAIAPGHVCRNHGVYRSRNPAAAAHYKMAQRLRPAFESAVLALATKEERAFHESEFTAPVFFPREGPRHWLLQRRPLLAAAITASKPGTELHDIVAYLTDGDSELLPPYAQQPHMLTVPTLRAEGWLAATQAKGTWGGKRTGAGPKRRGGSRD